MRNLSIEEKRLLNEQLALLAGWNKKHIEAEPEQVRKNIETMGLLIVNN